MRGRFMMGAALLASSGVLVAGLGAGGATAATNSKKLSCKDTAYNISSPSTSGFTFGVLKCSAPFGNGIQEASYKETFTGSGTNTKVTVKGSFKNYGNTGTVSGTYSMTGKLPVTGAITTSGPLKLTHGTGAWAGIKGKGKLSCTTKNAGKTYTCKASVTYTP